VSVFVPTTPNPTGYFVLVRKSDCIELDMSVDAALKYIVSMGVVAPPPLPVPEEPKQTTLSRPEAQEDFPWPCVLNTAVW
jgi:uncharacterized membrane protein